MENVLPGRYLILDLHTPPLSSPTTPCFSPPPNKSLRIPPFSHFIPFTRDREQWAQLLRAQRQEDRQNILCSVPIFLSLIPLPPFPTFLKKSLPPPTGITCELQKHQETLSKSNCAVCLSSACLYCLGKQCQNAVLLLCSVCNRRVKQLLSLQMAYLQRQDWE